LSVVGCQWSRIDVARCDARDTRPWTPEPILDNRQPITMTKPSRTLETFPNPHPQRDYEIAFEAPEFTCLCPMTGQPDFATIRIRYIPDQKCVELKSLKLYLWSYRDEGAFHEAVTNRIADDLITVLDPRYLMVEGDFYVRGGISTKIKVEHKRQG
jgi:7-cyano-7-deazaguanine reductase